MYNQKKSIVVSTAAVAVIVILGKLIGFGREALIAAYYGATAETDVFFFANSMPSLLFPAVCTAVSTAFLSLYVKCTEEKGELSGNTYASGILLFATALGIGLGGLGILLCPILVPLLAPGFSAAQLSLAIPLSRIMMGAFVLIMAQYMLTALLNAKRFFVGSQICGLLYSLVIVVITWLLGPGQDMYALTWTVVLALLIHAAGLAVCCIGRFRFRWQLHTLRKDVRLLGKLTLPILLGNSVLQLNTIVDKALSSLLPNGSLSALNYGNNLSALVISVFVTSLSTIVYPTLTSNAARGELDSYGKTLEEALSGLTLLLFPISVITAISANDIVTFIYARGVFNQQAVAYTATVLAFYSPMFVASGIREVLTRGFFALQNTKTPMRNSAIGMACNIVVSLLLVRPLGIAGIALGTTISTYLTAFLLLWNAHRHLPSLHLNGYLIRLFRQFLAGCATGAALFLLRPAIETLQHPFVCFSAFTVLGFIIYFAILFLIKYPLPHAS